MQIYIYVCICLAIDFGTIIKIVKKKQMETMVDTFVASHPHWLGVLLRNANDDNNRNRN